MAIIHKFENLKITVPETQYSPKHDEQKCCPVCGEPSMFRWSAQKYGGSKDSCFSGACAEPVPIGCIYGDIASWSKKEYNIPGNPNVIYESAKEGGYSEQLREEIKKILESWGFSKITFHEPGERDYYATVAIKAVHANPKVNIAFRRSPKMERVFCFENKYGVIALEEGKYDSHCERRYGAWSSSFFTVKNYCNEKGIAMGTSDKLIILPGRETLKNKAAEKILNSQKQAIISDISSYLSKNSSLRYDIQYNKKQIAALKEKYQKEFGEDCPAIKGDE